LSGEAGRERGCQSSKPRELVEGLSNDGIDPHGTAGGTGATHWSREVQHKSGENHRLNK